VTPIVDPTFSVSGPDWQIGPVQPAAPAQSGGGFGAVLGQSLQSLANTQDQASAAAQQLASGQATDPTAVVMAVERAQLAMQMASQIRTNAVSAAQDLLHTQV
jgi:flagellar hook-basal body complex protein FliE